MIITPLFIENKLYGLSAIEFDYIKTSISSDYLEYLNDINKLYFFAKECQKQIDNNEEENLFLKQMLKNFPIPIMLVDTLGNIIEESDIAKELLPTIKAFNNDKNILTYWNNFENSYNFQNVPSEYATKRIVINDNTYNLMISPIKDFDGTIKAFFRSCN